jgi:hypothetical protein
VKTICPQHGLIFFFMTLVLAVVPAVATPPTDPVVISNIATLNVQFQNFWFPADTTLGGTTGATLPDRASASTSLSIRSLAGFLRSEVRALPLPWS